MQLNLPGLVRFDFRVPRSALSNLQLVPMVSCDWSKLMLSIPPREPSCVCHVVLYDRLELTWSDNLSCSGTNMKGIFAAGIQRSYRGRVFSTPSCSAVRAGIILFLLASLMCQVRCNRFEMSAEKITERGAQG